MNRMTQSSSYELQHASSCQHPTSDFELRFRLQEILLSLQSDISSHTSQIEQLTLQHEQRLRQKDEIIDRLVKANEQLSLQNQQLRRRQSREGLSSKAQLLKKIESQHNEKSEMLAIIGYLERKNQELTQKINFSFSPYKRSTPSSHLSNPSSHLSSSTYSLDPSIKDESTSISSNNGLRKITSLHHLPIPNYQLEVNDCSLRHMKKSRLSVEKREVRRVLERGTEKKACRENTREGWSTSTLL